MQSDSCLVGFGILLWFQQSGIVLWMPLMCKWKREYLQRRWISPAENWSLKDWFCCAESLRQLSSQSCLTEGPAKCFYQHQEKKWTIKMYLERLKLLWNDTEGRPVMKIYEDSQTRLSEVTVCTSQCLKWPDLFLYPRSSALLWYYPSHTFYSCVYVPGRELICIQNNWCDVG